MAQAFLTEEDGGSDDVTISRVVEEMVITAEDSVMAM
jgi:hypothetical protein